MGPRSTSRSISGDDDTLVVAQIRGPHGIRGEVRVEPRTDVEGRLEAGVTLDCEGIGALTIASRRGTPEHPIIRFDGYGSRDAATGLRDRYLRVSRTEARRATAQRGAYLWADLIGLSVQTPEGVALGVVRELIRAGEADVLVVARAGAGDLLLPMISSVVREVDVAGGRMVAVPQEELT
jgi:16S rRNA processing protein RimM